MKCPFCDSPAAIRFPRADSFIWRCKGSACGLEFLSPQPTDERLGAAYANLYYPEGDKAQTVSFDNTPVEVLEQAFDYLTAKLGNLEGLSLLDYGCGNGRLCASAVRRGMSVTGIEMSATARREATRSGIPVFQNLEELIRSAPQAGFDLITLWDVIEHLRAPWHDLRALKQVMNPGGRVLISTMNTKSLRARLERTRWENYSNPTHTFFFDRHSLGAMILGTGFSGTEELILPIQYPEHGLLRRLVHRFLMDKSLNSEIVFWGRNESIALEPPVSDSVTFASS